MSCGKRLSHGGLTHFFLIHIKFLRILSKPHTNGPRVKSFASIDKVSTLSVTSRG